MTEHAGRPEAAGVPPDRTRGAPDGGAIVPRLHCGRCDRCGFDLASCADAGCIPGNCSMRPVPKPRTHCAGCGAPFHPPETACGACRGSGMDVQIVRGCWRDTGPCDACGGTGRGGSARAPEADHA